ncbi:MAG TPA: bifunctional methylenetetrahydrofolate dehydrogenase/methenyltetrahydrofolate cyclohydrolase FolD [Nitrospinota bacterium]|nr:bifunctional methylenetetrahydrofolate dehydrogenase/methenyltetrahydrofolate cyclohydrolase FolD [Nitrospinota bacterium]|tara:strand:- start:81488 stop:82342 length:855 start_codon:yes stop_codon:yes gene_type:complete
MAKIIDGKKEAAAIRAQIKSQIDKITIQQTEKVNLDVILVGHNPASEVYVRLKEKACAEVGIVSCKHTPPTDIALKDLLLLVDQLNEDSNVNGILLQLPLPSHLNISKVLDRIDPIKDVDGFHPINVGLLSQNQAKLLPCTPAGCVELLDRYNIPIQGKHAVIVGRSNIVGKPLATMLLHRNATVSICHSKTVDLAAITLQADILVTALGIPEMIKAGMVKEGAVVIDVGINRVENQLVGDVAFAEVAEKASWITPVPGGVGPMTIAMLLSNTLTAYRLQQTKS